MYKYNAVPDVVISAIVTMKDIVLCIFGFAVASVVSAPTLGEGEIPAAAMVSQGDFYRDKRSQYGVQYVSPCAAAAAAAAAHSGPAGPAYVNVAPYHGGYAQPGYGPSYGYGPHYRSVDEMEEGEVLRYSDFAPEQIPAARYAYVLPGGPAAPAAPAAPVVPAVPTIAAAHGSYSQPSYSQGGAAYGVFPNAKVAGCNVPLLFSCSPSIVQGHIAKAQPQYYPDSYRDVDALHNHLDSGTQAQNLHESHSAPEQLSVVPDPSHAASAQKAAP